MNSNNLPRLTLYPAVSKKSILNDSNKDLRDVLGFNENPHLLEEFKAGNDILEFPEYSNEEHPAYYILAEVEEYVPLKRSV